MPNFDRTGPEGRGPLTGRQMGKCVDDDATVEAVETEEDTVRRPRRLFLQRRRGGGNRPRRGLGRGPGRGRGRGRW